jgi:hypothetical protein
MAKPVISPATSVLGYKQWQEWTFQPFASGTPTSWSCSTLPPGFEINTTTGAISGTGTAAGVYDVALYATNGDGTSDPLLLTIGIELSAYAPNSACNVVWDVQSGEVTLLGASTATAATGQAAPLFQAKSGDDIIFFVRLINQGVYLDLPLTGLRFAIKELEPENRLILSTDGFLKRGAGEQTYYILHARFDEDALAAALSNYENDKGTIFNALGEFERTETNLVHAEYGPATVQRSSRTFLVDVERDIVQ